MNDKGIKELILRIYDKYKTETVVSAELLATLAMQERDPTQVTDPMIYFCSDMYMRQVAREVLRKKFEPDDDTQAERSAQWEMWPELQTRYPRIHKKGESFAYILTEEAPDTTMYFNADKLDTESEAKARHARAIREYVAWRRDQGLSPQEPADQPDRPIQPEIWPNI